MTHPHVLSDAQAGDEITFIEGRDLGGINFHVTAGHDGEEIAGWFGTSTGAVIIPDWDKNYPCTILNRDPYKEKNTVSTDNALDAKLDLAVDFELQAAFSYTNEKGETLNRRLKVDEFDGEYVRGNSFDGNGRLEGYRSFRVDRINGKVAIR